MRNQEIKRKIITETRVLISEKRTVTIKDIADKCFMNIASVNYYFGSKEQLIDQVLDEVILELKKEISNLLFENEHKSKSELLESMITYTYNFSLENIGLISYLFLNQDSSDRAGNKLIETFFSNNPFTQMIYEKLNVEMKTIDPMVIYAKYVILFSSFAMPLFISIASNSSPMNIQVETFKNEIFRQYFIRELLRIIEV
ncbi:TetR/AcrR family transcriptional regulator [Acholeplasma vituli]|uniref:TetR/AcrR family transcriptional regulator n=1 Tax=Paracholeplasma vituli TaxID=69473 RepID=A0ABT2PXP0_9MOLU|nr:TetR/AcrR family transcriptional regulator [Paracholeplasma vituli]MCU0104477.1 TetR/AcrR family transcriptional regulator [Paracholeplasma vituli]